jgi:hypothetical protein
MGFFQRCKASTWVFLISLALPFQAQALIPSTAGVELGGNGSLLITDPTIGAFGLGAGLQGSVFLTMWTNHPIVAKMRIESIAIQEEATQKSDTSYIQPGTDLKSATQSWDIISFGAQGNFPSQGQTFFWEALLGYAIGQPSIVSLTTSTPDSSLIDTNQTTSSGFVISGGVGIKRVFSPLITGLFSVRTMFLMAPTYAGSPLNNKTYIPLPLEFNVGVEIPFAF